MVRCGSHGVGIGRLSRRDFSKLALASAVALALPRLARAQDEPFKFGLTPVFLSSDLELLSHLRSYLVSRIGGAVELVTRRTYQEITALLVSGQIHGAWICGYPYVQFKADLDLVATPVWHGKPLYQSYLIAASNRPVDDWTGLKGDIHAFSDPDSNSGFLVTRALLAENQLRTNQFFSRNFYTYGHRNVIRAVASGLAQSGSVDGYVWEVMREIEPELVNRTMIVRKSEWLGFPPVASPKSSAGDPRIAALRDALVSMFDDPEGRKVLDMLRLDGFAVTPPEIFDTIAAKVETVRQFG
ncbi:PhnD/SsuA/transferrin family substrate-binding protein [Allomesorhizobium camelthorni]|uniref:PhnD/SsuA/transferrin family substrate-binding protein n=1 Tax=Allomesorhizobium camelthorni TaxID=475069 RepID=A0A6G4WD98_9HYPH|nr:PhnD/SsuA/transferrin family substrate-binding protein [Mesorhizobium camelthorni]NGO52731.1 PhnD/SsuA/transferrin family substrate-binding protein [Mesorhizobium camelthorni]